MSSIEDLRPTFIIARAFGLAPYNIRDSSISLSKPAIFYTTLWIFLHLYGLYNRLEFFLGRDANNKSRTLSVIRTIFVVSALITDAVVCILKNKYLQYTLNDLRKYDVAVKYNVATNARILRIHSWTIFGFLIIFFLLIGILSNSDERENSMAGVIYVYYYLPLSVSVMKFVTLVASIYFRFRHLNQMLLPGSTYITVQSDNDYKRLHFRDICWLHNCLCNAAKNVNSLYSIQLLMWFANFTLNMISRIDEITESNWISNIVHFIRDGALVLIFILIVYLIAAICHFTSIEANKAGALVFLPNSSCFHVHLERYKEDKFFIGQYFSQHRLHFTAASGFFRINLPLLLKIAGTMTTYLVILKSPTKC